MGLVFLLFVFSVAGGLCWSLRVVSAPLPPGAPEPGELAQAAPRQPRRRTDRGTDVAVAAESAPRVPVSNPA
jgi:hypothetical protein